MSSTVESRVVEMRFDNKHFEQNVSSTISILDKLKAKLNFSGSAKTFENINAAAKKVDLTGLSSSADAVQVKFSYMQMAISNEFNKIVGNAVAAGKRIVSALTIDPVKSGFQEYETQINAVQTILANTQSKGTTIDQVNEALEELNKYADMTIYNFTEMTRNIGTFTAAGVGLEQSVSAIKGIANLAAVSGSTSQQASTAMYQLSQALATGTVRLQDWNSVVNAGMGGEVFQDALVRTAAVMAGASEDVEAWRKENIDSFGSFRDSLTQGGWLTTDVLTETLNQFTMAAEEGTEEWEAFKKSLMDTGYTEKQAIEILKMANTATDAATKVKTFTQLWDVLKEAAQSGWSQTWKLIIGDFEEAKSLLTPLADFFTGLINKMSDLRNAVIESALGRGFSYLGDKINDVLKPAMKATDVVKDAIGSITDLSEIVDRVIRGDFGNGIDRLNALTEAGINYYEVQNKVNEKLGDSFRHSQEKIDAQNELLGVQAKTAEATNEEAEALTELNNEQKERLKQLSRMTDEQMRAAGYSEAQVKAMRDLKKTAEDLGIPFDRFIDQLEEINGRWLMIDSFKNIGKGIVDVAKAIAQAWKGVFPEHTVENFADKLFNLLGAFHKFSSAFTDVFYKQVGTKITDGVETPIYKLTEAGDKLVRTFKGVFAAIDIVTTVVGGAFKTAFKIVSELLGRFDLNILDVTAAIGDAIVGFRDWIDSIISVSDIVDVLVPAVKAVAKWVNIFVDAIKGSEHIQSFLERIEGMGEAIREWFETLKNSKNLPADIIAGLANGIRNGVPLVIAAIFDLAKALIDGFCEVLGIHSPSRVMADLGGDTVEGLKVGITAAASGLIDAIKNLASKVIEAFKGIWEYITGDREKVDFGKIFGESKIVKAFESIAEKVADVFKNLWKNITDGAGRVDWGSVFSGSVLIAMAWFLSKIAKATGGIADALGGIDDLIESASKVLNKFANVLSSYSWDLKAKALQKMAIAVAILVAALVVLTEIDDIGRMWNAVAIIGTLALILVGLAVAVDKLSSTDIDFDEKKISGLKTGLMQIGIVMLMLAAVVKIIGSMDPDQAKQGFKGLGVIALGIVGFLAALGGISRYSKDVDGLGKMMIKLAIAMGLMVVVMKLIDGLEGDEVVKGALFAAAFVIFVNSITKVAKTSGNNVSKVGGLMIKLAIAMGLMVGVVKLASSLSGEEMIKGAAFATGFGIFVKALVSCAKIGKKQVIAKVGGLILSVSISLGLMVGICKLIGRLTIGEMIKGAAFVAGFTVMLKFLIKILSVGSETQIAKVTGVILAMAIATAILAAVAVALSFVDLNGLAKGVAAVGLLGLVVTGMVKALKGANNVMGSLIVMTIAVAVMAAAIVALTFIDDTGKLKTAAGCLAIVMGMFALIAHSSKDIAKASITLITITVVVGLLAGILYLLTNNIENADAAIKVAIALGILMGALAVTMKIMAGIGPMSSSAWGAVGAMIAVLAGVAIILGIMDKFNVAPSIETAISISILLLALTAVTAALTLIGGGAPAAIAGLGAFAVIVIGIGALIAAIGWLTDKFPKLEEFLNSGIPIMEKIGEGIGRFVGGLIGGIGEGLMSSLLEMVNTFEQIVDKLVVVSEKGTSINPKGFIGVEKLLDVMGSIGLTTAGTTLSDIFTLGGTSMEKFQADGVAFFEGMKAIGAASEGIALNEEGMDAIIKMAKKLAGLQASLEPIGGVMSWFKGRDDLGAFGTNIGQFISSMKLALDELWGFQFDAQTLDEIIKAAKSLADLQASLEPIGGVISWFTGRNDLGTFGTNIGQFITSMKTALALLDGFQFDAQTLDEIVKSAKSLADLQSSLEPIGGVMSWFAGRDDLGTFGTNVGQFISSMKTALATLEGTALNEEALASVVTTAEKLADLQTQLEPMGGVIAWFTGRDDLGTFGTNVGLFADAMGKLKTAVGDNGITQESIDSVTYAGTAIAALQEALPEETWFDGKMDLSQFSKYITDFSTSMKDFATTASEIDTMAVTTAINTAHKIKNLITSLVGLDTSGLTAFTGVGTGGFGADGAAYKVAQSISKYSDEVAGIDVTRVTTSISAANRLKTLITSLVGLDVSGVENFKIDSIGKSMKSYGSSVSKINITAVDGSITSANKLRNFILSLTGLDTGGVGSFKAALNELATIDVAKIVKAFDSSASKMASAGSGMIDGLVNGMRSKMTAVKTVVMSMITGANDVVKSKASIFNVVGGTLMDNLANGILNKQRSIHSAISVCVTTSASSIYSYYGLFYTSGSYLVSGFANGISDNAYRAVAKARAMASAAAEAAREALGINSPSRVFKDIGAGIPEGFALGIEEMSGLIRDPLRMMTDLAISDVSKSISHIAEVVSSDIDAQPTIAPVVDLSNVKTGVDAINSMLGMGSTIGVSANASAANAAMNRNRQNGSTGDVISAIDKLSKKLDNAGVTNYYTLDGINYNDGDDVADAMNVIIRAARMERRM